MTSSNHRASSVMIHLSDRESDGQFVEARFKNRSWTGDKTALDEERIFFFSIIFFSRIRAKLFYDYSLFYCYENLQRTIKKTFRSVVTRNYRAQSIKRFDFYRTASRHGWNNWSGGLRRNWNTAWGKLKRGQSVQFVGRGFVKTCRNHGALSSRAFPPPTSGLNSNRFYRLGIICVCYRVSIIPNRVYTFLCLSFN